MIDDTVERRVECTTGLSPKLLFRVCQRGIKTWCSRHRKEHLTTWNELEALRVSINPPDACIPVSDHTEACPNVV